MSFGRGIRRKGRESGGRVTVSDDLDVFWRVPTFGYKIGEGGYPGET